MKRAPGVLIGISLLFGIGCGDDTPSSTGPESGTTESDPTQSGPGSDTTPPPDDDDGSSDGGMTTTGEPDTSGTTADMTTTGGSSGSSSSTGDPPETGSSTGSSSTTGDETAGDSTTSVFQASTTGSGSDDGITPYCGDGKINLGEECDDGINNGPTAGCTPDCTIAACGDGYVHVSEACDLGDGNGPAEDCTPDCEDAACGDGYVHASEACDDGNEDNDDACIACVAATCGDGFVQAGVEDCDDADADDLDRCRNSCSFHRVDQISLGGNHTCAHFDSDNVMCWGSGASGRRGSGNVDSIGDDEPAYAAGFVDVAGSATAVHAGGSHTCVEQPAGVRCFGAAWFGQLGYGNTVAIGNDELPSAVGTVDLGGSVDFMATAGGSLHNCARVGSETHCWGDAASYQLGINGQNTPVGDNETPDSMAPVVLGEDALAFATGVAHTCALLDAEGGPVYCWGSAANGALGYGNLDTIGDDEDPADAGAVDVGGAVVAIAAGWYHTCAVLDEGGVRCWGRGNDGRLGYGNTLYVGAFDVPDDVGDVQVGAPAVEITGGLGHTCVRTTADEVRCWGYGGVGQLGYAGTESIGDDEHPHEAGVVNVGAPVVSVAADGNHTCAITDTGSVRCWGEGADGRLGYGNTDDIGDDERPADVGDVPLFAP